MIVCWKQKAFSFLLHLCMSVCWKQKAIGREKAALLVGELPVVDVCMHGCMDLFFDEKKISLNGYRSY
jgi:hypothetical protein